MLNFEHVPVLQERCLELLAPALENPEAIFVDATVGLGGHSLAVLKAFNNVKVIGLDRDENALAISRERLNAHGDRVTLVHAVYDQIEQVLEGLEIESVHGILFDLGVSSMQLDNPDRGFAYSQNAPLDMRMNNKEGQSAQEWLANASEKELHKVIKEYGEERFALSIAKAIVASREQGNIIGTTRQLASLVASVVRSRDSEQDPATRTFQAIRIHINQELHDLEKGLEVALKLLKTGGRLVVISFHSLEDRIVKQFMQGHSRVEVPRGLPLKESQIPKSPLKLIDRIKPSSFEISANPRSRSAVMRVAQKVGEIR
mgnify:CR=1 FL=1